ncbi:MULTISPECIES: ATP-dependent helicase [unclassified Acinetobacter]|uniref:ATP-dependent helicase n=1 Tax=unclassified Acinetobacter TaxID=196816 RepID=UPI00244B41F1|nr:MULTISPECIES: ATP-dependent helicase [unclassified Acinetobacter]MDH0031079.1 ATP-dependent helicase [Acinetobacter sp. GD04021]MDH0886665.1 ATP-dependent helicase [Acinetobacter sp. GD03873]MDH1083202.1 ATP-dependent helicase [Acinetobacter sp. GD03983]MDH2189285.1 ATP-dependent helicase [Acinetobacter sp. GD03645]MDH2202908.1 ATP-dependent helicase [Acinetobacter sp. GD03647]
MTLAKLIDELNPQQKRAATTTAQNCLVLAGAGCGKTKTIVARAAYLIDQGLPAQQIQILTFTRRAASEIVTRVEQHMGAQAKGLRASTFHTFCMYLLRRNPKAFGLTQFSIIDRDDQLLMFRLLRGKDKGNVLPKAAELCDLYSYARNTKTKLSDALVEQLPQAIEYKIQIAELMKAYEQRKQERHFLDYDDILGIVAVHLQSSPELVNWVTGFCSALLVDEMQDTNPLQWALLQPLIGKVKLFCVGDDAQSIYGFRGADFENIHHFKERVPDAEVLTLEMNYRSTQGILDLSNWLLGQSAIEYEKHLQAYRGKGLKPQLHILSNEFEEANWIIQDLNQRHSQGAAWAEHMVLLRSGFSGRYLEGALIAANIPYRFIGGVKLLESAHVKDVLSLLRVSVNPQDDLAWMRFLTLWDGVGDVGASKLAQELIQLPDIKARCQRLERHGKVPQQAILILMQLDVLQQQVEACIGLALDALNEQLENNYKTKDWSRRVKDFDLVKQLARKHSSLGEFLEEYVLDPISISEIDKTPDQDLVTLITIHSAKGAEQKVCYVPHVSPTQYPHARAQGDFDDVEEERRVLYVALTRAENELILTKQNLNLWSHDQYDELGRKIESYFLNDLPQDLVDIRIHRDIPRAYGQASRSRSTAISLGFGIDLD